MCGTRATFSIMGDKIQSFFSSKRLADVICGKRVALLILLTAGVAMVVAVLLLVDKGRGVGSFFGGHREVQKNLVCADGRFARKIMLGGDILLGRQNPVWTQIVEGQYSPQAVLGSASELLRDSDAAFFNFEGVLVFPGQTLRGKGLPDRFSIGADPEILRFLGLLNRNIVLSFANNHSADFGIEALERTMEIVTNYPGVVLVGVGGDLSEAIAPEIVHVGGVRVGFLAFTDLLPDEYFATASHSGVAALTDENLRKGIVHARESADIVIVYLHTDRVLGKEFSAVPDEHQRHVAYRAIEYGADLVVGSQPHGLQVKEVYRGKVIWYSLGVFLYNPDASGQYLSGNSFHNAVQFYGGGLLRLGVCKEGIVASEIFPTKMIRTNDGYELVLSRQ